MNNLTDIHGNIAIEEPDASPRSSRPAGSGVDSPWRWWRKYRIVRDHYSGYECQVKYIWWPWWIQMGWPCNTHSTIEKARAYILSRDVVEYL